MKINTKRKIPMKRKRKRRRTRKRTSELYREPTHKDNASYAEDENGEAGDGEEEHKKRNRKGKRTIKINI